MTKLAILGGSSGPALATSDDDGATWAIHAAPSSAGGWWNTIANTGSKYILIGYRASSRIAISANGGVTWTANNSLPDYIYGKQCYNGSRLVVIATHWSAYTPGVYSDDQGLTWTACTGLPKRAVSGGFPDESYVWGGIAWNGSRFCAVAKSDNNSNETNMAAISLDGSAWVTTTLPALGHWSDIAWNGTVFCALMELNSLNTMSNVCATSPDGQNWTLHTMPATVFWRSIAWNGVVFCAVANATGGSAVAATSADGETWFLQTMPVVAGWEDIAYNGTVFCAVAGSSTSGGTGLAAISSNGTVWGLVTLPAGFSGSEIVGVDLSSGILPPPPLAIANDRDILLQFSYPRVLTSMLPPNVVVSQGQVQGITLVYTEAYFRVDAAGVAINPNIVLTATLPSFLTGFVTWSKTGAGTAPPTAGTTNTWTILAADQTGDVARYTATIVQGGLTYTQSVIVTRLRDGADGTNGLLGPQGPSYPFIHATFPGLLATFSGAARWRPRVNVVLANVQLDTPFAPPSDVVVDIKKNGVSIFGAGTKPKISAGALSGTLSLTSLAITIATTDYVTLDVVASGGSDMTCRIDYNYA